MGSGDCTQVLELECQAHYPTGSLPQPFWAFHCGEGTGLQIQGRHRTHQKQYVQRHSGMFYVWCAKPLLAELNQNLQLVGVESATLPGPSRVGVSTSILLVLDPLQCPRPPGVGESSQPQTGHQKEELSCCPCLPWRRPNPCTWFH